MSRIDGTAARRLDFGDVTTTMTRAAIGRSRAGLRLAVPGFAKGPGKYKVLEHRRRQAQIAARHLLDLTEATDARRR
jgi:hypothetical protein